MEWIFAVLLFVLGGNGDLYSPNGDETTVSTPQPDAGTVSIMTGAGGFPPR